MKKISDITLNRTKAQKTASASVYLFFALYLLIMTNGYFNLMITKTVAFCLIAYICCAVCFVQNGFSKFDSDGRMTEKRIFSKGDISMLVFSVSCVASTLFSDYKYESLTGSEGRFMGLITMLSFTACYFMLSRFLILNKIHMVLFGVISCIIVGFACLQFCGLDPFYLYVGVKETQQDLFVSTLGNINVFSSFICLCASLFMYIYCIKKTGNKIFVLVVCFFSFVGSFVCNSDSVYLGIGAAFILLACLSLESIDSLKRFFHVCLLYLLSSKLVYVFVNILNIKTKHLYFLSKTIVNLRISYFLIALLIFLIILFGKISFSDKALKNIKIVLSAVIIISFDLLAVLIIYFSVVDKETNLKGFGNYIRINENWGTFRGYIWRRVLEIYGNLPFIHKLFGTGEDTLWIYMNLFFGDEMESRSFFIDNAHNDVLQYFVTTGLLGAVSYLCFVIFGTGEIIRSKTASFEHKAFAFAAFIFFIQSLVNITQPVTTPLLFLFISIARSGLEDRAIRDSLIC